jgi:hypothetical protein
MRGKILKVINFIKKQPKLWLNSLTLRQRGLVVFLFLTVAFLSSLGIIFYNPFSRDKIIIDSGEEKIAEEEKKIIRLIDGIEVGDESLINPPIFAVQIENMIDGRPLSGLSKANLVYETLVEAGITRFLALFISGDDIVPKIGPVRSARPYYIDWAEEYRALYVHSGGSPEALEIIPNYDVLNFDEFANGRYFWRDNSRYAPHNLYTSYELLKNGFEGKEGKVKENFISWQFKEEMPEEERPDSGLLEIYFSSDTYLARWKYQKNENVYLRYQGDEPKEDREGGKIKAKNIAVQFTDIKAIDEVGRKRIRTIGEGEAMIFHDGIKTEGTWKKEAKGDRTKFYDKNGEEIKFNPGVTWIEVAPIGTRVTFE